MNTKGFTVIELIISFSLVAVVIALLFQLVISLRELYLSVGVKTELLNKQALISEKLNDDFNNLEVVNIVSCGEKCLNFSFNDGTNKDLIINKDNNIFKYGEYTTILTNDSAFLEPIIDFKTTYNVKEGINDSFFIINIPIKHRFFEENFGITAMYQYDSRLNYLDIVAF